jgi:Ala-tRNA(Pro) deacylase
VDKAALATESEMKEVFYDCEVGIVPAFGSLYGLKTLVDPFLAAVPAMFIEGNNHHEALRLSFQDYRRIEHPMVARVAYPYQPSPRKCFPSYECH